MCSGKSFITEIKCWNYVLLIKTLRDKSTVVKTQKVMQYTYIHTLKEQRINIFHAETQASADEGRNFKLNIGIDCIACQ
jgi:hypothetical protein